MRQVCTQWTRTIASVAGSVVNHESAMNTHHHKHLRVQGTGRLLTESQISPSPNYNPLTQVLSPFTGKQSMKKCSITQCFLVRHRQGYWFGWHKRMATCLPLCPVVWTAYKGGGTWPVIVCVGGDSARALCWGCHWRHGFLSTWELLWVVIVPCERRPIHVSVKAHVGPSQFPSKGIFTVSLPGMKIMKALVQYVWP